MKSKEKNLIILLTRRGLLFSSPLPKFQNDSRDIPNPIRIRLLQRDCTCIQKMQVKM
uniref:Uncharacterized protein n=1 Tax=Rhizophora mucronata TaxID=61149 RepID=A0A2P2IHE0_RHIMU